ncbi:MAG: AraC family transcriptional regulator [Anaerostipes sp.]|nr:AraC family transcriptional regulator [Anaerostipes sp.]
MKNMIQDFYLPTLNDYAFSPCESPNTYPTGGKCFRIHPDLGEGYFWLYNSDKNYNIKIHDFSFKEDVVLNMSIPECLSVTYYTSISGEELMPYRRMSSHIVKSFLGGYKSYKALIHKNIPIKCLGIEYSPAYYDAFLIEQYHETYQNPQDAFRCIDETADFPEMVHLLSQVWNYQGTGLCASMFYDAKATEALSLVFEHHRRLNEQKKLSISDTDKELLSVITSYIGNHYADKLSIEQLSKIACMGTTKLKRTFKAYYGKTISQYIQETRIGQAEQLLAYTNLTIGQISQAVGYSNPGRFAELFRESNGILPLEYRKISRG